METQRPLVTELVRGLASNEETAERKPQTYRPYQVDASPVPQEQDRPLVKSKLDNYTETSSQLPDRIRDALGSPKLAQRTAQGPEALFLLHLPHPERGLGKKRGKKLPFKRVKF